MTAAQNAQKGQSLFEERFCNAIKPFLCVCQFFCAAPLNPKLIPKPLNHVTTRREKLTRFVHIIWCIVMLTCILTSTYFQYSEFDSNVLSFLTRILYFGEYISGMLNSAIIIIGCHYQLRWYRNYFRRLIEIDWKIHISGGKVCYLSTRLFHRRLLIGYLGFFCCVITTDFMYNRMDPKSFFRSSTVYSIPNIISIMALSEYFTMLFCLKERYRRVIDVLTLLPNDCGWQIGHSPMKDKLNVLQIVPLHPRKLCRMYDISLFESTIETLRQVCLDLTELYLDVNSSYGILIITTVVSTFLILSIQFYALYTFTENLQENDMWLIVYTGLWIILHGGKSFFVLYYNNAVNKEVSIE